MKGKHFRKREKMSVKTKSIILSSIAVLELLLLMVSMTFSWFEGLTSLEMNGTNLSTAGALKSHVEVGENTSETDTTYNSIIDLTEFFDAQKEVRLSPVSSADAENFYVAYSGTPGVANTKYRKLSQEDINANVIQFEFTLSSPDAPCDVYLSEIVPRVFINGTERSNRYSYPFRFAFNDGEVTHILSTNNVLNQSLSDHFANQQAIASLNSDDTANTTTGTVERTRRYSYYANHRTSIGGPYPNSSATASDYTTTLEPLYQLSKGETKIITMSVWLEALDYELLNNTSYAPSAGSTISFGLKLCTSWSIPRTITVYDYTSDHWIDTSDENHNNSTMELGVRNLDNSGSDKYFYEFTYNSTNKCWTGNIPIALQNCEFVWRVAGTTDASHEYATWTANSRGNRNEISMFGSDDCVWGIGPDDVIKIGLSDKTANKWLDDQANGKDPEMRIQIPYNGASGVALNYSMTASYQVYEGLNTWFAYIPETVDSVTFSRCERDNNSNIYNQWYAPDRGDETIYYAMDGETTVETVFYENAIYLNVPDAYYNTFMYQTYLPAVSLTHDDNVTKIQNLGSTLTDLLKSNYYMGAHGDTWIGTGQMTEINDSRYPNAHIYAFYFDAPLADGEYLTFWNRSQSNNHNNIDNNVSFAPAIQYNSAQGNMMVLSEPQQLTDPNFNNNYISYDYSWLSYSETVNVTQNANVGQWGKEDDITIYVDFSGAGSNWGSGHYLSITASSNSGLKINKTDTGGAGSYVPENDTWVGEGTLVSGSTYKWVISADELTNLTNYGFTIWSNNESNYSQVWSVDISHVDFSTTYNTYTISSSYTTHNNRQADCFTLTASKNTSD